MKVIKKITAIMLSIMMVLGMCSVVGAADVTAPKGKITINNAISGQTYKIYKILTLESYDNAEGKNLYSYKPADNKWDTFFRTGDGAEYVNINENGYVEWKPTTDETEETKNARAAELAKKALVYVSTAGISFTKSEDVAEGSNAVEFSDLELGYYLVDSSAGALCGLTTTNSEVAITEKNEKPKVEKEILDDVKGTVKKNSANIGDYVYYMITIDVKYGAENYVLHDKMNPHLNYEMVADLYDNESTKLTGSTDSAMKLNQDYTITPAPGDGCAVHVTFTKEYFNRKADRIKKKQVSQIIVKYAATVKDSAPINTPMENTAWLTYGDKLTKSNESVTNTYTFGIPVFKHTGTGVDKKPLAGAEFKLYTDVDCTKVLTFTKNNADKYRYDTASKNETLTSSNDGMINIEGIKEGTYYLKEIEAPKGYNKLAEPIKIIIEQSTDRTPIMKNVKGESITKVEVENKSGSLLPSTGGIGTTVFYIAGAFLVLISGVVLIAKKRTDSK